MSANAIDIALGRHAVHLAMTEWGEHALRPIGPHLSALLPLEPAIDLQRRWHVVQTESQQEGEVAKQIEKAKMDVFHPRVPRKVRVNAVRHRTVMRPMLTGYVFAGFDVGWDAWQSIIDMRGVLRLLMIGERPVPIPQSAIDHLRMREEGELTGLRCKGPSAILLKLQALVRILEPFAFAGLFGTVAEIDQKHGLVGVELDIFGRIVPVKLTPEQVEAV